MAFRVSKFRHVYGTACKPEERYSDLSVSSKETTSNTITVSTKFFAIPAYSVSGGNVIVHSLEKVGRGTKAHPVIQGHTSYVTDMTFSPFDDNLLFTSSDDATIKIWRIPDEGLTSNISDCEMKLVGHKKRILTIKHNPTSKDILASGSLDQTMKIWDIEEGKEVSTIENIFGGEVEEIDWNWDGSQVVSVCKDTKVRIFDPRTQSEMIEGKTHVGTKSRRVCWLGNSTKFITTGFGRGVREYSIFDSRSMEKPLTNTILDSSTSILMPFFDNDSSLLFLAGKSEGTIRAMEILDSDPYCLSATAFQEGNLPQKGLAMLPKRAVDVTKTEIVKFFKVTPRFIESISFQIPRKTTSYFAKELYPDTKGPEPSQSGKEWQEGQNKEPILISLEPTNLTTDGAFIQEEPKEENQNQNDDDIKIDYSIKSKEEKKPAKKWVSPYELKKEEEAKKRGDTNEDKEIKIQRRDSPVQVVRQSLVRHTFITPGKTSEQFFGLKLQNIRPVQTNSIDVNEKFFATPLAGIGGNVGVFDVNKFGRIKPNHPIIRGHSGAITDLCFSPHKKNLLATASEDGHVKLWTIPENGLTTDLNDSTVDLSGHKQKITLIKFHPLAENVLVSNSADCTIKLWDIEKNDPVVSLSHHNDVLTSLEFNYEGLLVATLSLDNQLRIFDPRTENIENQTNAHESVKGSRLCWLGDTGFILTAGYSKTSSREVMLHDLRNFSSPLKKITIDQSAGILMPFFDPGSNVIFLAGKGDGNIKLYELQQDEKTIHYLSDYRSSSPQVGVAAFPLSARDFAQVEIARFVKLMENSIVILHAKIPRTRAEFFQDDLFPPVYYTDKSLLSAQEYFEGSDAQISKVDFCPNGMTKLSDAPQQEKKKGKYSFEVESKQEKELTRDLVLQKMYEKIDMYADSSSDEDEKKDDSDDSDWN